MFTAMFDFKDGYGRLHCQNARINGYLSLEAAVKAVVRRSPLKSGHVQIGLRIVAVIKNGKLMSF